MDKVFTKPIEKQFEFDEDVAFVFDDMLDRSVPFYKEVIKLVANIVELNTKENSTVLDLGCSTANTLLYIDKNSDKKLNLIGYDNSEAMLEVAKKKIKAFGSRIELVYDDIVEVSFPRSDVILANYMLQFIRPLKRVDFIEKIYNSLYDEGIFIFSEKIIYDDKKFNKQMIDIYYDFKKSQGYSDFEISQKREALENVLVPYSEDENKKMIKECGFRSVETIFKWGNFATFMAKR